MDFSSSADIMLYVSTLLFPITFAFFWSIIMCSNKKSSASTEKVKKNGFKSKKAEENVQIIPEHFASPEPPILAKKSLARHPEITDPTTAKVPAYVHQQRQQQKKKKTSSAEPLPSKKRQQQQYSTEPASSKDQHHHQHQEPMQELFLLQSSVEAEETTELKTQDWMKEDKKNAV